MSKKRTTRTNDLKFKVAIEAVKAEKQISQIAKEFNVHPQQVTDWKKQLLDSGSDVFSKEKNNELDEARALTDNLYKRIGIQSMEIDFLKKNSDI